MGRDVRHVAIMRKLYTIGALIGVLVCAGLVFVYSASSVAALEHFGTPYYFLKKQLISVAIAGIVFLVVASTPLPMIKKTIPWFLLVSLVATILTLVPAVGFLCHGSRRWLYIAGFSVQPSEFLKASLILFWSLLLEQQKYSIRSLETYLLGISLLGIGLVVLLRQPDFGSCITLSLTFCLLWYSAGAKLRYLKTSFFIAIPMVIWLIYARSYRLARIMVFLNPWQDPQGKGFQIIQSLIAIGSGGGLGQGILNSRQKFFYLPMQHTDFIFSIIAEETGLLGSVIMIMVYAVLIVQGFSLSLLFDDRLSAYCTCATFFSIILQTTINLGVVTGMIPTKGLGLPFISYGGSSLVSYAILLGVMCSAARYQLARRRRGIMHIIA